MEVGLVGEDAAVRIVREQLADGPEDVRSVAVADADESDLLVVSDEVGADTFDAVNDVVTAHGSSMVTIEHGGIGGTAIDAVQAGVAFLSGNGPCHACLSRRVSASGVESDGERSIGDPLLRIAGAHAGERLASQLDTYQSMTAGEVLTLPYQDRHLLPVPGCPACAPDDDHRWRDPAGDGERSLEEASQAAERFLEDLIGPVAEIGEARSMPLPYYLATLAATKPFSDGEDPSHAAGVAEEWNLAFMKGMGEAIERYAAACYLEEQFRKARPGDLPDAIPLERCVRPSDWDPIGEPIPWVPGETIPAGEAAWLPAELVVFPPPERTIRPAITTGLALGNTPVETALSGLLEVIERDATMLAWHSTFEPLGLEVADERFDRLVRHARSADLTVDVSLLTQDVDVPVVGAFVSRPDAYPRFAAGSSADFDATAAAIDAVREALQNWMELEDMGQQRAREKEPRLARYAADGLPSTRLADPEVTVAASDVGGAGPASSNDRLATLAERVRESGMTPHVSWLTTRDLRACGFTAARVVMPEAQPLLLGTSYFGDRAREVPAALGFEPRFDRPPHPFP